MYVFDFSDELDNNITDKGKAEQYFNEHTLWKQKRRELLSRTLFSFVPTPTNQHLKLCIIEFLHINSKILSENFSNLMSFILMDVLKITLRKDGIRTE